MIPNGVRKENKQFDVLKNFTVAQNSCHKIAS